MKFASAQRHPRDAAVAQRHTHIIIVHLQGGGSVLQLYLRSYAVRSAFLATAIHFLQ